MSKPQCIAVGNPFDGIQIHGPFDTDNEALEYAEYFLTPDEEWWIVSIQDRRHEEDQDE